MSGLSHPHSLTDHVTPYDKFAWSDTDIEHLLVTGEHERELAAYFGEREYRELTELARRAAGVRRVHRGSLALCRTHATHARAASHRANVAQEGVCLA